MRNPQIIGDHSYRDTFGCRCPQPSRQFMQIENHERFFFADLKASAAQPGKQVRRLIMAIDLPFENLAQF
jgi:hypothetical protein